jgi:hypothetical protein
MNCKKYYNLLYESSQKLYRNGGQGRRLIENHWRIWDNSDREKYYYHNTCAIFSRPKYNPYEIFPDMRPKRELNDKITEADVMEAKHTPIEAVLKRYNVDIRRGRAKCPVHKGEGFNFSWRGKSWKCFTCGASGSVVDLVMLLEGVDFVEAVKILIS